MYLLEESAAAIISYLILFYLILLCFVGSGDKRGAMGGYWSERRSLAEVFEQGTAGVDKLVECRANQLLPADDAGSDGAAEVPDKLKTEVDLIT